MTDQDTSATVTREKISTLTSHSRLKVKVSLSFRCALGNSWSQLKWKAKELATLHSRWMGNSKFSTAIGLKQNWRLNLKSWPSNWIISSCQDTIFYRLPPKTELSSFVSDKSNWRSLETAAMKESSSLVWSGERRIQIVRREILVLGKGLLNLTLFSSD